MIVHYEDKEITLAQYIKEKIRMLQKDFFIKLTEEEIQKFKSMTREIDIDHYAHDLIANRL